MNPIFFRQLFMFLMLSFFVLVGCTDDEDEVSYDIAGSWRVVYFMEGDERITKTDDNTWPDVNNGDITAVFTEPDGDGNGEISGITVSNVYFGEYTLLGNDQIEIGPVATTFINEPEWTQWYNLSAVENYEVDATSLTLYYNSGQNRIVFERD